MESRSRHTRIGKLLRSPLVTQIAELASTATGTRLLIIYPEDTGWREGRGDSHSSLRPEFCKLIQSTPDGAKHCRMCHILMTVAACSGGPMDQTCHAGASVLVSPVGEGDSESIAVLSSCLFVSETAWDAVVAKGRQLGIDSDELRRAFNSLPRLEDERHRTLRAAMTAMSEALRVLRRSEYIEERLRENTGNSLHAELVQHLENTAWALHDETGLHSDSDKIPLIVRVVRELVHQRPDLPLSVKELAAAARLTPNHFTTLFHEHTGISFTDYLTDQRMRRAKKLLTNPTLNITEIAHLVGYDDPGYFSRRFRQQTGLSPRKWRDEFAQQEDADA